MAKINVRTKYRFVLMSLGACIFSTMKRTNTVITSGGFLQQLLSLKNVSFILVYEKEI